MTPDNWPNIKDVAELWGIEVSGVQKWITRTISPNPEKAAFLVKGERGAGNATRISPELLPHDIRVAWYKRQQAIIAEKDLEFVIKAPSIHEKGAKEAISQAIELSSMDAEELKKMQAIKAAEGLKGLKAKEKLAKELGMSVKTLYYHIGNYQERIRAKRHGDKKPRHETQHYGPKRGRPIGTGRFAVEQARAIELYSQIHQPSKAQVYEQLIHELAFTASREQGVDIDKVNLDEFPSKRLVSYWLQQEELSNMAEMCFLRHGDKKYTDKYAPSIRRDWSLIPAGHTAIGDHHEFDCIVITPEAKLGRPWWTAWLDGNSNAMIGYTVNFQPCAAEILLALRNAINPDDPEVPWGGLMKILYCDNGKDYLGTLLNGERKRIYKARPDEPEWGFVQEMGMELRHTMRYHGQSKPIEPFFGVIERGWINQLPGWCGHNVTVRPEKLKEEVRQTQLWLDTDGREGKKMLLWWWEFEEELKGIVREYNSMPQERLNGMSPMQAYELNKMSSAIVPNPDTLDLIILPTVKGGRTIQPDGIHFTHKGEKRLYVHQALWPLIGQKVEVRYNPHDLDNIVVLQDNKFVCRASSDAYVPPFAETQEEKARLAEFIEGREALRKEYREKRKALSTSDPRCYPKLTVKPFEKKAQTIHRAITRYDEAAKKVKVAAEEPVNPPLQKAEGDLILWKSQLERREQDRTS